MNDEIKVAAERLFKWAQRHSADNVSAQAKAAIADCYLLAQDYLLTHPADEDEPVDMDFLRRSGLPERGSFQYVRFFWMTETIGFVARACQGPKCWDVELVIDKRLPVHNPTRGQLRLLCRALSIPLTEPGAV